jgi:hypothetical protein
MFVWQEEDDDDGLEIRQSIPWDQQLRRSRSRHYAAQYTETSTSFLSSDSLPSISVIFDASLSL